MVLCIVPAGLEAPSADTVERWFGGDPEVRVVVERRLRERRGAARRRLALDVELGDRRRIRSRDGRRFLERRRAAVDAPAPLPRRLRRAAHALRFVVCVAPDPAAVEDAEANRLVAAHQSGDRAAFGQLYLRYRPRVLRALRSGLGDHHAAEDLTQEVFVVAMGKLDRYEIRPDQPLRAWLLTIARYEALNHRRRERRVVVGLDAVPETEAPEPSSFEERMLGVLTDPVLEGFVQAMPTAQRQVVVMRYVLDYRLVEIAAALGKTPEAVRQLHARGLAHLEARMTAVGAPTRELTAVRVSARSLLRWWRAAPAWRR